MQILLHISTAFKTNCTQTKKGFSPALSSRKCWPHGFSHTAHIQWAADVQVEMPCRWESFELKGQTDSGWQDCNLQLCHTARPVCRSSHSGLLRKSVGRGEIRLNDIINQITTLSGCGEQKGISDNAVHPASRQVSYNSRRPHWVLHLSGETPPPGLPLNHAAASPFLHTGTWLYWNT